MHITLSSRTSGGPADVVVVPFFDDRKPGPGAVEAAAGVDLVTAVKASPTFRGRVDDTPLVIPPGASGLPTVVVVGLGARATAGPEEVRVAAMRAASAVRGRRRAVTSLGQVGTDRPASVRAAVEGALLGAYAPPRPEARPQPSHESPLASFAVLVDPVEARRADVRDAFARGRITGERVSWVRTLTQTPSSHLTPTLLAEEIARDGEEAGYTVRAWTDDEIAERGFGGLLAVSKGSAEAPRLVELCYGDQERPLGLVGKGITFDSGGINLKKPLGHITYMKSDMASAAAVAAAVSAAARMRLDVGVCAVLPLTENMPGGSATRPGDVIRHPDGRTTEVTDTDAEGRLVLADGIAHLASREVSGIIDVGTLTEAAGYGPSLYAAASTDDLFVAEVLDAGAAAGEHGWRMPLVPLYVELMRSTVADLVNETVAVTDTSVLAATYLRQFAGDVPWVHLDVGSTAWLEHPWAGWPDGPTGTPTRTLVRLLEGRAAAG